MWKPYWVAWLCSNHFLDKMVAPEPSSPIYLHQSLTMGCKARTERVVEFYFENQLPRATDLKTKGEKSSHVAHRVCI